MIEGTFNRPPLFLIKKYNFTQKNKNKTIKKYTLVNKIVFFY
jgi:hypothetical protein